MPTLADHERAAIAAAIREIRARHRLTQEAVADRGGIGRKYVGSIERGETLPSFAGLVALARGLDVPLSEIITLYEERLRSDLAPRSRLR